MSTTSPAQALTLQDLTTIPDPTAQWGAPATKVQVQNASPFIITATIDGETFNIQSFTAQTLPTAGGGTSLLILPTTGPAGAQGTLTAVWLQNGEAPPMADGQLTGAAQYAQGLGSLVYSATLTYAGGTPGFSLTGVPVTTRTLLFAISAAPAVTLLEVIGNTSGFVYYAQPPYLKQASTGGPFAVVPVSGLIDQSFSIKYSLSASNVNVSFSIYADTAQYNESIFYNGPVSTASIASTPAGTILLANGPFRLLAVSCVPSGNGNAAIIRSSGEALVNPFTSPATLSFDAPGLIIPAGDSVSFVNTNGTYSSGSISYAYP